MPRTSRICRLLAIALIISASVGNGDERRSLPLLVVDGKTVPATIEELTPEWGIAVRVDGQTRRIEPSEYVLWGAYSDDDRSSQILLTDDSVLVGDLIRIEAESVTIASLQWGELQLDRRMVRAFLMLPKADPLERDRQWQTLRELEAADRVLLRSGDAIEGRLLPTTEQENGGLFGLISLGIELPNNGESTSIGIEEIQALTFHAPMSVSKSEGLLGFRDGSLVAVSTLTRPQPRVTQIGTAAGASLRLRNDELRESLTFIQPQHGRITYLSDLPALGYKSLPFLKLEWPLGVGANTLGGRLRSAGNIAFKGLGMHSTSRVAYNLDGKYQSFQAEVALDDHAGRQGSVVYRVLVERDNGSGERQWSVAFTSPILRGGDPPLPITIDVTSATRMALVVEMADRADTRDYANWLNARLVKP
ncbi:MAG: NPCBM/NEW2 domain-containing protein [Pirellulaceae bacterium]